MVGGDSLFFKEFMNSSQMIKTGIKKYIVVVFHKVGREHGKSVLEQGLFQISPVDPGFVKFIPSMWPRHVCGQVVHSRNGMAVDTDISYACPN